MKKLMTIAVLVLAISCNLLADGPCYYRITVEGDCECVLETIPCPDGAIGTGIYRQEGSNTSLITVVSELTEWDFEREGLTFLTATESGLIGCQGIIQNQWGTADPNFLDCESGDSSFQFDIYGSNAVTGEHTLRYVINVDRLCSCEDYFNALAGFEYEAGDPELPCDCDCETDPACAAAGGMGPHQGQQDPNQASIGADEPGISDPIIPGSGALVSSITDIHLPGRMMDIYFTRTYRGDIQDPGFTRSFFSPGKGQRILLSGESDEFRYPDQLFSTLAAGSSGGVKSSEIPSPIYDYAFMEIMASRWTVGTDCFNVEIADPNDPEVNGIINFDDLDGGSVTVETDYVVYGTNDPNGQEPQIYFNSHAVDSVHTTSSRTFTYDMNRYTCRLGRKWDNNYNISLYEVQDPNEYALKRYILLAGNGKKLVYKQPFSTSDVIHVCESDPASRLYYTENGFELHKKGGTVWRFNSDLRISAISDINGNQITFSYNNGLLYTITNDAGNYLTFYYDAYNMIDRITDNFGRIWDYNRDTNFDLVEVEKPITGSTRNLTSTYTYIEGNLLETATDGAGQTWLENVYNDDDRIITQRYGDESYTNTYHFNEDGRVDYVDAYDRKGNLEKVYLTGSGLMRRSSKLIATNEWADTIYTYDFDIDQTPEFESQCLVQKIERPAGDIYEFEYDTFGNTTKVTHKRDENDEGLETEYTYTNNISSLPLSFTDTAGNVTHFDYSTNGNLIKISLPEITVTDVNDITNVYATSPEYNFDYNQYGQITKVTLPDNRSVYYSYYTGGKCWVKDITYAGGTHTLDYDTKGNIASITDPDGVVTTYTYDNISRLTEVVNALNSKTQLSYNDAGLVDSVKQQLGASFNETTAIHSTFEYTSVDKLKKITDTLGRITELSFDDNDNVTQVTDPQGRASGYSTNYAYNALDLLESITLPEDYDLTAGNQNVTTFTYTVDGLTNTATDAEGNTTQYYYDGYRRLYKILYPDTTTQTYTYDKRGFIISETKRDETAIYYTYDAIGRLTDKAIDGSNSYLGKNSSMIDYLKTGTWASTTDTESISGRYVTTTDPNASYTLLGEKAGRYAVAVYYPSFAYSSNDSVKIDIVDGDTILKVRYINQQTAGDMWHYLGVYDFEDLPQIKFYSNGSTNTTAIDAVKFVPVESFNYDIMGRLKKTTAYEFTYDAAGRLTSVTDAYNRTVSYEYTPAGRRSKLTWPDGFYVTYGYDEVGRLNAIYNSNDSLLWSCAYDEAGRRTQTTGIYGLTTTYDYEDVENNDNRGIYLEGLSHTLGANTLSYTYSRDSVGNITTEDTAGTEISYLYDKNYSLISVDYETGDDLLYDYDNLFSRVTVTEGIQTTNYTNLNNGLNQYASIGSSDLIYDDNGNLTRYGTKHYLYDAENQMAAYYNIDGDPCSVAVSLYGYDSFGRRVSKATAIGVESTTGIMAESYLYDGFQVIGQYTADSVKLKRRFIYAAGIDEPICMVVCESYPNNYNLENLVDFTQSWLSDNYSQDYNQSFDYNTDNFIDFEDFASFVVEEYIALPQTSPNDKYYGYAFDGTGSVIAMTYMNDPNETGNPNELPYFVETYSYTPFGNPTIHDPNGIEISQSAIGNPYMFTAREYDTESGLYYYRYRMYSPQIGRFMQTDPIGYYDSMNMYQYCLNNPINFIDPWGLKHYDFKETQKIIRSGQRKHYNPISHALPHNTAGQSWPIKFMRTFLPGYDFKYSGDTFTVPKPNGEKGCDVLTDSEFGNYLAGYLGYYNMGDFGLVAMFKAGDYFARQDGLSQDDYESQRDIVRGYNDAKRDLSTLNGFLKWYFMKIMLLM